MTSRYPAIAPDILSLFAARGTARRRGRRSSSRPTRSSTWPARICAAASSSPKARPARRFACGPNSPFPSASTTSPPGRHAAPLFLSRRGVPPAPRGRQRVLPGRHRGSRRPRHRRAPTPARSPTRMRCCRWRCPARPLTITLGDQTIFEAVLAALGLPRGWRMRLARAFGSADDAGRGARRPRQPAAQRPLAGPVAALVARRRSRRPVGAYRRRHGRGRPVGHRPAARPPRSPGG